MCGEEGIGCMVWLYRDQIVDHVVKIRVKVLHSVKELRYALVGVVKKHNTITWVHWKAIAQYLRCRVWTTICGAHSVLV